MYNIEWVPIKNYEGIYEINNFGEIKSLSRKEETKNKFGKITRIRKEKIIKPVIYSNGYLSIELNKNGDRKRMSIHRLVYISFIGEIPKNFVIHHKDKNKKNNCLDNLALISNEEHNNIHKHTAWNKGLKGFLSGERDKGIYENRRKKIKCLNNNIIYNSINDASSILKLNTSSISEVLHGKRKTAGGYYFERIY